MGRDHKGAVRGVAKKPRAARAGGNRLICIIKSEQSTDCPQDDIGYAVPAPGHAGNLSDPGTADPLGAVEKALDFSVPGEDPGPRRSIRRKKTRRDPGSCPGPSRFRGFSTAPTGSSVASSQLTAWRDGPHRGKPIPDEICAPIRAGDALGKSQVAPCRPARPAPALRSVLLGQVGTLERDQSNRAHSAAWNFSRIKRRRAARTGCPCKRRRAADWGNSKRPEGFASEAPPARGSASIGHPARSSPNHTNIRRL